MSDPLHRLMVAGLTTPWGVWRLARGGFDDDCDRCGGTGIHVRSPCSCRAFRETCDCTRARGCPHCATRCRYCRVGRLPPPEVLAEDFGDDESRAIAEALGAEVAPGKRIDMDAPALGGWQ